MFKHLQISLQAANTSNTLSASEMFVKKILQAVAALLLEKFYLWKFVNV